MNDLKEILLDPILGKVILVSVIIVTLVLITRFTKKNLNKYIKENDNRYKTKKVINILGYIIAIILIVLIFIDDIRGVTITLGVASAGIAFALQEVIVSIAGWVAILTGNIYKAGDRVEVGGIKGDVIDLGVLRTTIMEVGQWVNGDLYNGRIVRVANSFVFKQPVFNYSANFPFLWDEIKIPIKFGGDYLYAKDTINNVAEEIIGDYAREAEKQWKVMVRKFRIENASTKPMVTMIATDNWVEYTLRYVVDYRKRRYTKDLLFTRILEEVHKSGDRIELASATFDLVGLPKLDVNYNKKTGNS
ncbi:mechanosensitive ion channel family protein [Clostridium sp. D2Q-11]|uniref:Mechanosensitive ion channel family protein n=1 Tax=Anaeromonas frigoriresistens TaxID=2683708 RepID=A0A942UWS5_9FIRM|nr:mechanosensitive ion channel domain-containing protein [Anaeromonas frigoriresistens]MBS4539520.1 mechanosensitive ion channel family protein [Anaeromonas frigoriresistens]